MDSLNDFLNGPNPHPLLGSPAELLGAAIGLVVLLPALGSVLMAA